MPAINTSVFCILVFSHSHSLYIHAACFSKMKGMHVLASLLCHFFVCLCTFDSLRFLPLQPCRYIKLQCVRLRLAEWIILFPTFRAWHSSISHPWRTLMSQSLSLRTLPRVVCNGFFTEMTEWPLKPITACLFAMSAVEVLFWCRW